MWKNHLFRQSTVWSMNTENRSSFWTPINHVFFISVYWTEKSLFLVTFWQNKIKRLSLRYIRFKLYFWNPLILSNNLIYRIGLISSTLLYAARRDRYYKVFIKILPRASKYRNGNHCILLLTILLWEI